MHEIKMQHKDRTLYAQVWGDSLLLGICSVEYWNTLDAKTQRKLLTKSQNVQ